MKNESLFLPDEAATRALGLQIGATLRAGAFVTLRGELGAGKTTFAQGVAAALKIAEPIASPTFVLINEYASQPPLLHLDAYRLENLDYDALRDAGIEEFLERRDAIRLVEWPQMIAQWLPNARLDLAFFHEETGRRVEISERP